jgi:VWFA-related protein
VFATLLQASAICWVAVPVGAQEPQQAPSQPPPQATVFRAGTSAIVLDVVVRDRRGRPVVDLQPGDVTVVEDGQPREIRSFRLIERAPVAGASGAPAASVVPGVAQPDPLRRITLVSLVFDHLGQNARALAQKAARDYVARPLPAGQWVGVFRLDDRLHLVQAFTRDTAALATAVDRATATAIKEDAPMRPGASRERAGDAEHAKSADREVNADERHTVTSDAADPIFREAILRMQALAETADLSQRGHGTFYPLMALARAQGGLEGRKAILFFSEGLQVPAAVEEAFKASISEANRANVSIYAVDARGLDAGRDLRASGAALERASRVSQGAIATPGSGAVSVEELRNDDLVETALRSSPQAVLRELAESTGGALIANTNDIGKGLDRVTADLASYYEIAYVPRSGEPDGAFRRIEVKVARRGVDVTSRSGYFALPATDALPLLPYELPLLAAAAATPPPYAVDFDAGVFRFHDAPRGRQLALVTEVQTAALTLQEDAKTKRYRAHVALMALVKDAAGSVVERLSRSYPLEGPLENAAAVRRGKLLLSQQLWLPPGRYTITAVVRDHLANRASVRRLPIRVFPESPGVDISTVALVKRVDKAGDQPDPVEDPFRSGPLRIVPSVGTPISKAANSQISAFVILYPDKSLADAPSLTVEFAQGSTVIGRSTPALDAPDADGRVRCVATFPAESFAPGTYELRAIARQGESQDESRTTFTIVP